MKITKSELKEIIKEEAQKFKRKFELEKELKSLQEQIEEVHTSGTREIPGGGGHGYGKNFKTKNREGGPESLVEDEFEEFSFEDEMEEKPIMSKDELDMDSMHSEEDNSEEDIDIDAILAEIMNDNSHMEEGEEHMEGIDEMENCDTVDEMEDMNEMDDEEVPPYGGSENPMDNQVAESNKKKSNKIISEEISRMQQLAGIKKVI